MKMDNNTAIDIEDTIMGVPREFTVDRHPFWIYPVTLGKSFLVARIVKSLGMKPEIIKVNPFMEALRLCKEKRREVCRLIATYTTNGKGHLFNGKFMDTRTEWFSKHLKDDDMAQLLSVLLQSNDLPVFMKQLGIDKEKEWQSKAVKAKGDSGSLTFGGKSIYGTLIDAACERYGWTFDYVVWGISYVNLQMMLADSISSVYLSTEERKKARIPNDRGNIINGDDPASIAKIKAMSWD